MGQGSNKGKRVKVCMPSVCRRGHEGHEERLTPSKDDCKSNGLEDTTFDEFDNTLSI